MEHKIIVMLFVASSVTACNGERQLPQRSSNISCETDTLICVDGSQVTRNPNNNCEFDPCSSGKISQRCGVNQGCAPYINIPKH